MDRQESERSLTNKLSRGEFIAAFLLQSLMEIETGDLRL